jgi:hypothetical protein
MAAKFDISKHSTCHDIHNDCIRKEHRKSRRRIGRIVVNKEIDDCCEVQYNGDANMTSVRGKHQEFTRNSRIIDLAILKKSSQEGL